MTEGYQEQWAVYRARNRNLMLLGVAQFLGFPPFLALVAFMDRKLFSATTMVGPAAGVWAVWYISTVVRLRMFSCPRCAKNFFGGVFPDPSLPFRKPRAFFGKECAHCGLRKFADS